MTQTRVEAQRNTDSNRQKPGPVGGSQVSFFLLPHPPPFPLFLYIL